MLTKKEKAVAILMLYAAQNICPENAIDACTEVGIEKSIVMEAVKDLENFRLELSI